jgi:hypothetical protein
MVFLLINLLRAFIILIGCDYNIKLIMIKICKKCRTFSKSYDGMNAQRLLGSDCNYISLESFN